MSRSRFMPIALRALATGASLFNVSQCAMPVSTRATEPYSRAQIANVAKIPMGMSRCGWWHSSAAVETESKPIYVKKTIAPPVSTPE